MTLRELIPGLFISGHTRSSDAERSMILLQEKGITRVVCLAPRCDLPLSKAMTNDGLQYTHIPLTDGKYVMTKQVNDLAIDISKNLKEGKKVLIHCNAGRNRAPLVAARVMIYRGWHPEDAIARIRETRNTALANEYFVKFIMEQQPFNPSIRMEIV